MKKSRNLFLVVFVLFLISSCENNREPVVTNATFKEVTNIFKAGKNNCAQCHDANIKLLAGGVKIAADPLTYSDVMNTWILKTPTPVTTITLVDYKKSSLYLAVNQNGTDLKLMKPQADLLTPTELSIINKWLAAGAPEK
jgi:hypothetical protein